MNAATNHLQSAADAACPVRVNLHTSTGVEFVDFSVSRLRPQSIILNAGPRESRIVLDVPPLFASVGQDEFSVLSGHALELARAAHVLQRVMTRFEWNGEFGGDDRANAGVGIDFITGMVAGMLDIAAKQP
ncbi:MAG: hypothetical protein QM741_17075 [Rudaea sp.]|uniref:hypothetical protein n=1 Tax=Rudaea sp. TaxID=2136325 RepID=UPI0039E42FE0